MNSTLAYMLSKLPGGSLHDLFKRQPQRIGHEATPLKKVRKKTAKPVGKQRKLIERQEKKKRRMEYQSRRINRLRGVG